MKTSQMNVWSGDFGADYTARNQFQSAEEFNQFYIDRFGLDRTEINKIHLGDMPRDSRFLEMGCNVGNQLIALQHEGFSNLFGVELQQNAVEHVHHERPSLNVVQGTGFDIPFKDRFFDVVFTNNVLIHISPDDLSKVMHEMHRVSKSYIWGFEYFAPEIVEIPYRGQSDLLWKADYCQLFLDMFDDLELVDARLFDYQDDSGLTDKLYLLRKRG